MANSNHKNGSGGGIVGVLLLIAAAAALLFHLGVIPFPWLKTGSSTTSDSSTLYVPDPGSIEANPETGVSYVNNIVLIFFEPGTTDEEKQNTVDMINGEVVGALPVIDQLQVRISTRSEEELKALCRELELRDSVAVATYDEALQVSQNAVPDDPWGTEYGHAVSWDKDTPVDANWWVNATDAITAWDYEDELEHVKVGVVDNGFDTSHEDLVGRISEITENNSVERHGTLVAGVIGATHNNRRGISGIVEDCEILTADWQLTEAQKAALAETGEKWSTTNQIVGESVMLIEHGAKVINLSAGKKLNQGYRSWDYNGEGRMVSAFLRALLARGYDFVIVQAAGNGDADKVSLDAVYNGLFCAITHENCAAGGGVSADDIIDRIIVVGAAGMDGSGGFVQASWSNAGPRVDICAPGVDVYSSVEGNAYDYASGTSMAAPVVAGTAASVWAANSGLSGADVKRIVCQNTKGTAYAQYSDLHPFYDSYPMVNTQLAVEAALEAKGVSVGKKPEQLYASVLEAYRNSADELRTNHTITAAGSRRVYLSADTSGQMFYAFHDIDGNGVPELLIGAPVYLPDHSLQIIDVYGLNGETPVSLFKPMKNDYFYLSNGLYPMFHEGEIPVYSRIFSDGTICTRLSLDEEVVSYVRTRLASDGYSLMTLQGLFANYTYLNPATPEEPAAAYYAYSEKCENPNADYDDFIIYCLELYGAPFLQSEPYGVQNDYDDWTVRYCSQNGAMISPEWKPLLD